MSIVIYHTIKDLDQLGEVHMVAGFELEHETANRYESIKVHWVEIFLIDVETPIQITKNIGDADISDLEDEIEHHSFTEQELEGAHGQLWNPEVRFSDSQLTNDKFYLSYEGCMA